MTKIKKIITAVVIITITPLFWWAINTVATGFKTTTSDQTIDAHWVCLKAKHTWWTAYFIPTKSATEWSNFVANNPTNTVLASCAPSCSLSPLKCDSPWKLAVMTSSNDNLNWRCYEPTASCLPTSGYFKNCTGASFSSCSAIVASTFSWTGCSSCPNGSTNLWTDPVYGIQYYGCQMNTNQVWKYMVNYGWQAGTWSNRAWINWFMEGALAINSIYWSICSANGTNISWQIGE